MSTPNFSVVVLTPGGPARAEDVAAMFAGVASFLSNDTVTTDNINASNAINILTTDGGNLTINVPNAGGNKSLTVTIGGVTVLKVDNNGFHFSIGGVHIFTVDASGNAVFKGTVTPSGSPT